jgi:hypothetical protein
MTMMVAGASVNRQGPQGESTSWDLYCPPPTQQQRAKPNQRSASHAMRTLLLSPSLVPKRLSSHTRMRDNYLGHKARCGRSPKALARPGVCHGVPMPPTVTRDACRKYRSARGKQTSSTFDAVSSDRACIAYNRKEVLHRNIQSERGRFLGRDPARSTSLRYSIRSYSLRCLCRRSILKSSSRARHNANSA